MKLPSIDYLTQSATYSLKRFPLVIISACIAATVATYLNEFWDTVDNPFPLMNLMLVAVLGISAFFSIKILIEKKGIKGPYRTIAQVVGLVVLMLIYISLPDGTSSHNPFTPYYRFAVFSVCVHLVVSFLPYLRDSHTLAFWNYNKVLFLNILASLLFSMVIAIGSSLALAAITSLFEYKFDSSTYVQIFIWSIGLVNTWIFLSKTPRDLEAMDNEIFYPKGLKIFSQYILLPLLTVYLLILYSYTIKVTMSWDWPKGIVTYLVICISILGIFTFLLLYPNRKSNGQRWIEISSMVYYGLLIPLILVLYFAIGIRINDYGITINRYLIVLLGAWLTFVSFYFVLGFKNIKFIPISLAFMLLITSFGPWGIYAVSERSQFRRLKSQLRATHLLLGDKVIKETIWDKTQLPELVAVDTKKSPEIITTENKPVATQKQVNDINSITRYLEENHGLESMNEWFSQDMKGILKVLYDSSNYHNNLASTLYLKTIGVPENGSFNDYNSYTASIADEQAYSIKGYDYSMEFDLSGEIENTYNINEKTYSLKLMGQNTNLELKSDSSTYLINLKPKLKLLAITGKVHYATYSVDTLTWEQQFPDLKTKLIIRRIIVNGSVTSGQEITTLNGILLTKDLNQ